MKEIKKLNNILKENKKSITEKILHIIINHLI